MTAERATLELVRTPLICRMMQVKPEAIDRLLDQAIAVACEVIAGEAVGLAVVDPERALSVIVDVEFQGRGFGASVARKALSLAFAKDLPDVVARARHGSRGARLAVQLGFRETRRSKTEVFLRIGREQWNDAMRPSTSRGAFARAWEWIRKHAKPA